VVGINFYQIKKYKIENKIMIAYITEINSENFKMFTDSEFSLVDIWAPWCGPCKLIAPMIDEISSEYQGQLSVGKLNADENSELVKELGIRNIPTLLFFKNGEQVKDSEGNTVKLVGSVQKEKLKEVINENL
jgi:thioredoxin 1